MVKSIIRDEMQAFISYKREDQTFAERVRDSLRTWGYKTWLDIENIPHGAYWPDEIDQGLKSSDIVVGLLSLGAIESRNVRNEWDWAISAGKKLLLLLLQPLPPDAIPHRFISINYIDFTRDQNHAFAELQDALANPQHVQYHDNSTARAAAPTTQLQHSSIESQKDANRARILNKVRNFWVEGVLENALNDSPFELGLTLKSEAVLKHVHYGEVIPPTTAGILKIFDDLSHDLLILGAPGAGKTILMLQLARDLLSRAEENSAHPIPVVLNLASWAEKRLSLEGWLTDRLTIEYQLTRRLAQRWLDDEKLLPMLDGLDEVRGEYRDACVEAINVFRHRHPTVDMVVCSRIVDYEQLSNRLQLSSALLLQPLTDAQIDQQLQHPSLATLRAVVETEPHLRTMAQTPFLLNTMVSTYREMTRGEIEHFDTEAERLRHMFHHYVKHRYEQSPQDEYTLAQMRHWLTWLAARMTERKQSIFYIETLSIDWGDALSVRRLYRHIGAIFGLLIGLLSGTMIGTSIGALMDVPGVGLLAGLFIGGMAGIAAGIILTHHTEIRPAERLIWQLNVQVLLRGLFVGLPIGALITLIGHTALGRAVGITGSLLMIMLSIIIVTIGFGIRKSETVEARNRPNQGIYDTAVNALTLGVGVGVISGIVAGIALIIGGAIIILSPDSFAPSYIELLNKVFMKGIRDLVLTGVVFGTGIGVAAAFAFGGGDMVIKHLCLRYFLHRADMISFNYAAFLDFCSNRMLLRKVGGGYIFAHRMLLEYFAQLETGSNP